MKKPLTQRLYALSLAALVTLTMLGSVSQLFLGDEAQQAAQALLAQQRSAAPRA